MKKFLTSLLLMVSMGAFAQSGKLVPDSSKAKADTLYGKFVYVKGMEVKVDSGYARRIIAPMLFKGEGNISATTDKVAILEIRYYVNPGRKEVDQDDIIMFKPKNK